MINNKHTYGKFNMRNKAFHLFRSTQGECPCLTWTKVPKKYLLIKHNQSFLLDSTDNCEDQNNFF